MIPWQEEPEEERAARPEGERWDHRGTALLALAQSKGATPSPERGDRFISLKMKFDIG